MDPFRDTNQSREPDVPQFASAVEVAFCQYAIETMNSRDDVSIHRKTLVKYKELWKVMRSTATCFACFSRSPENTLRRCQHSLCSTCTRAHGDSTNSEPWSFRIETCPLCEGLEGTVFFQKPNTAGIRAIILEGGGIRGIVPLSFFKELEKTIDLPMDLQDNFDIAFGSSSGWSRKLFWSRVLIFLRCIDPTRTLRQQMARGRMYQAVFTFIQNCF